MIEEWECQRCGHTNVFEPEGEGGEYEEECAECGAMHCVSATPEWYYSIDAKLEVPSC